MLVSLFLATCYGQPVQVTPASYVEAKGAQVAIDQDSSVYIAYGVGDTTFVSVSNDKGRSYGEPIKISTRGDRSLGKLALGMRRGPRISVCRGVITVTATYGAEGKGRDGNILAFRSSDRGRSWSNPVKVNDVEGSAREGLHGMAVAPDGTVACAWLDLRGKGTTIFMSVSKDGGSTWSANQLVYESPSGSVCECCHPSLSFDANGKLFVMFRNSLYGARDMYITSSSDLKGFSSAQKLGTGSWLINACPMDGGMLSAGLSGNPEAIWRRESTIYSSTGPAENGLATGRNPWIAQGKEGSYFAWQNGNEVTFLAPGLNRLSFAQPGMDPVIASSPDGKLVIGAWSENGIRAIQL